MSNNKISEWIREVVLAETIECRNNLQTKYARDYAKKLDRLVEAARNVSYGGYKYYPSKPYRKLEVALRDIELESEDQDARTN